MMKSSILSVWSHQTSIKNPLKNILLVLLLILPLGLLIIFNLFETQIAVLIQSLNDPSPRIGFAFYIDFVRLIRNEILWLGFFFILAWAFAMYLSRSQKNVLNPGVVSRSNLRVLTISCVFLVATLIVGMHTLREFPNSSDEYAYIFQADMFSKGKLWGSAHDLPDFFYSNNIAQNEGIRLSRFPPGWPLILSLAFVTGIPSFLMNPLLGLITLLVFYCFGRKFYGEKVAVWSLFAMAFSGFYIFNSASFFSHISCLLVTLLFVYNIYLYNEKKNLLYGLLAGFFLGFVIIIRYYTAVLIFVPFLIYQFYQYRLKAINLFLLMGLGGMPCMMFLFWYNYSITGNAFLPVTVWAYPSEKLGFVNGHTFWKGLEHFIRWMLMFCYWCSPGLLILYGVFLWRKIKSRASRFLRPEDYTFLILGIGYFFYYQIGGNQYGPRFLFEAFPFLVLLVVSKVFQYREKWTIALLLASLLFAIVKLPFISARENRIINERRDLYDLVDRMKIKNAVVFVSSPTSPSRPMPQDDLTRNNIKFDNEVIYALELPHINDELMKYYDDRSFYRYVRNVDHPRGELIRIKK